MNPYCDHFDAIFDDSSDFFTGFAEGADVTAAEIVRALGYTPADVQAVEDLRATVATKADKTEVEALAAIVDTKADKSEIPTKRLIADTVVENAVGSVLFSKDINGNDFALSYVEMLITYDNGKSGSTGTNLYTIINNIWYVNYLNNAQTLNVFKWDTTSIFSDIYYKTAGSRTPVGHYIYPIQDSVIDTLPNVSSIGVHSDGGVITAGTRIQIWGY